MVGGGWGFENQKGIFVKTWRGGGNP